jgi:hypothetical protein
LPMLLDRVRAAAPLVTPRALPAGELWL